MLEWLPCLLAPRVEPLVAHPAPPLAAPGREADLATRAAAAAKRVAELAPAFASGPDPARLLLALGCTNALTRAADQDPETAGRAPVYEPFGAWAPLAIPLPDGVTLHGHHSLGPPGAPIVVVVHGLFDSHVTLYVVELAEVLRRWGFHVVALDLRDHGRLRGRPPTPGLGLAEGRDLLAAVEALTRAEPVSVGLLGLSYGGHCVVRAAHEASRAGKAQLLRGGVLSVCAPLDLPAALAAFDGRVALPRPPNLLGRVVLWGLLRTLRSQLGGRLEEAGLPRRGAAPFRRYVERVLLPGHPGVAPAGDVDGFLEAAASAKPEVLADLEVPTLLVHATDDPLVPVDHLQQALAAAGDNPLVHGLELGAGGHVGLAACDGPATLELLSRWFGALRDG